MKLKSSFKYNFNRLLIVEKDKVTRKLNHIGVNGADHWRTNDRRMVLRVIISAETAPAPPCRAPAAANLWHIERPYDGSQISVYLFQIFA